MFTPKNVKEDRDRMLEIARHFPTLLRRWDHSIARMYELTASHQTLTIRLEQVGRVGNLQLACIGPMFIQGPTEWRDAVISVEVADHGYVVRDRVAGLLVKTEHVEIAENKKPFNNLADCDTASHAPK